VTVTHPPRFDLDRYFAGSMESSDADRIKSHLTECEMCRSYLDEVQSDHEALMQRKPSESFAGEIASGVSSARTRPRTRRLFAWGFAAAGAACLAIMIWWLASEPSEKSERWMGQAPAVRLYLYRGGQSDLLGSRQPRAGDQLRYEISLPENQRGYAAVISVEGSQAVPILPGADQDSPIPVKGNTLLPGSVVLDPGGPVRLLLVVRPESFELVDLLAEVRDNPSVPGLVHELKFDLGEP
jgi:hypothetical protein